MRVNLKTAVIIFSVLYIVLTLVTMYRLYSDVIVRSDGKLKYKKQFVKRFLKLQLFVLAYWRI